MSRVLMSVLTGIFVTGFLLVALAVALLAWWFHWAIGLVVTAFLALVCSAFLESYRDPSPPPAP